MKNETRNEWLDRRKTYIGGTDSSAIIGVNPYRTGLDVWLDKTNRADEQPDNEKMFWGRMLEDVVARVFSERTGLKCRKLGTVIKGIHGANIDRQILGDRRRGPGILECKTADSRNAHRWGEPGSQDVPEEYLSQFQHYLGVTGYAWGRLAVLIGGNDFRIYDLPRDDELIDALMQAELKFWNEHVLTDEPPTPESLIDIAKLYPKDSGREIVATSAIQYAAQDLKNAKRELDQLQHVIKDREFLIKKYMEDATTLFDANGLPLATWKTQTTKRLDQNAARKALGDKVHLYETLSESRVFRLK